jgi:hypothetical protein
MLGPNHISGSSPFDRTRTSNLTPPLEKISFSNAVEESTGSIFMAAHAARDAA